MTPDTGPGATGEPGIDDGLGFAEHRWVAHALLQRAGRLLVLHRRAGRYLGGHWDIPGGTVKTGESPREAARRETSEESGLHVRITDKLTHLTNLDTGGRPICFHTVTYRAEATSDSPVVLSAAEHDEYQWATPQQALALDLVWHVRHTVLGLVRPGDSAEASTS